MGNLRSDRPLRLDASDDDQVILAAVLEHYRACRVDSAPARALLERLGISEQVADGLGIGVSDRSLGLSLPKRRIGAGDAIRDRLVALGLYRPSGHEHLVGCVVVPVRDRDGAIVGVVGLRLDHPDHQLYVAGLSGGVFNEGCLDGGSGPLVVASSITDALVVIGAGYEALAPGRPGGFHDREIRQIASSGRDLLVVGPGEDERLARRLAGAGASVRLLETVVPLVELVAGAASACSAIGALIESARVVGEEQERTKSSSAAKDPRFDADAHRGRCRRRDRHRRL